MDINEFGSWPAKSPQNTDGIATCCAYHMLDVAAVAEVLLRPHAGLAAFRDALVLLVALHDLGKVSDDFRNMLEHGTRQKSRHWKLSEALYYLNDDLLGAQLGSTPRPRQVLYAAVAGHHGTPSELALGPLPTGRRPAPDLHRAICDIGGGQDDARRHVKAFCALWPDASLGEISLAEAQQLSWWLSGLCTVADWIGSNIDWFPPRFPDLSLAGYRDLARDRAERAVAEAGLGGVLTRDVDLYDFSLRPMQKKAMDMPLTDGPMLAVIEDETGSGKTEAALLLAQRMLLAGKGRGLYFALPTMATADAMFARSVEVMGRLFQENPTLTLAHGRARLSQDFASLPDFADLRPHGASSPDAATCSDWLRSSPRRALLADVGVGTVDQALLATLPVRFQALRVWGLSSKILIIDEVHQMGVPYMAAELEALLKLHRAQGGSAILLTATLPLDQRARLLDTYDGTADDPAYPALTIAGGATAVDLPQQTGARGAVEVVRLAQQKEAVRLLAEAARAGAACVWVRNAVDDAIAAVEALRDAGIDADLLHARMALCDRKHVEAEMRMRFGKDGGDRAGRILVGTQVLESSLDLDFDVMVSDLAPMASLIQRAGRLWRHMDHRPAAVRPVKAPVLYVLSPDPGHVEDARWLHGTLDRGAYVYPVSETWRTARVLFDANRIVAPSGLRALIEAVHGAEAIDLPETLQTAEFEDFGKRAAERGHAAQNIVDFASGYRVAGRGDDDTDYPTRLGEPQRILVLARSEGGKLHPWSRGNSLEEWALSEVSARRSLLDALPLPDQQAPEIQSVTADWPDWKRREMRLCPVERDGRICDGLHYGQRRGLQFRRQ
ncbi:CRISPR-associated helicase Cas3' [Sedimentitalea sp. HM32M-2]|uniref:CRISPR-associated helicase Cas3' n=1 Tax=Sedimentitalea sp. HM32M-2 TaxID=3351566 RepID=UPI00362A4747